MFGNLVYIMIQLIHDILRSSETFQAFFYALNGQKDWLNTRYDIWKMVNWAGISERGFRYRSRYVAFRYETNGGNKVAMKA